MVTIGLVTYMIKTYVAYLWEPTFREKKNLCFDDYVSTPVFGRSK